MVVLTAVVFWLSVLITRNWPINSLWGHFENSWCHFRQNGQFVTMCTAYRWWRSFIVKNLILPLLPCMVDHASRQTACLSFPYLSRGGIPHIVRFEKVELAVFEAQNVIFTEWVAALVLFHCIRTAIWVINIVFHIAFLFPSTLRIKKGLSWLLFDLVWADSDGCEFAFLQVIMNVLLLGGRNLGETLVHRRHKISHATVLGR